MQTTGRHRPLSAEQRAALARIEGLIEYWRITPDELDGLPDAPGPVQPAVKYRHPRSGETWDGEGAQPDWLRRALLQEGFLVSELRPAPAAPDPAAPPAGGATPDSG